MFQIIFRTKFSQNTHLILSWTIYIFLNYHHWTKRILNEFSFHTYNVLWNSMCFLYPLLKAWSYINTQLVSQNIVWNENPFQILYIYICTCIRRVIHSIHAIFFWGHSGTFWYIFWDKWHFFWDKYCKNSFQVLMNKKKKTFLSSFIIILAFYNKIIYFFLYLDISLNKCVFLFTHSVLLYPYKILLNVNVFNIQKRIGIEWVTFFYTIQREVTLNFYWVTFWREKPTVV